MKKKISLFLLCLLTLSLTAVSQAPQKLSYQTVIRDAAGNLVVNTQIGLRLSILQGSPTGTAVFSERHVTTTNGNGLATAVMGNGAATTPPIDSIDWTFGPYFIQADVDPSGGTNYSINGTSQLLSVPYALWAANGPTGPQGPQGPQGPPGLGVSCSSSFNQYYTIRGSGSGGWECNDVLQISGSGSNGSVGIKTTPNISFGLLVRDNVGIGLNPSSSFEFAVDGDAYFDDHAGFGTNPNSSYDVRIDNNLGIGWSPNSSFELSVDGDIHVTDGISVGTTSTISTGVMSPVFELTSSSSGSGTNVIMTSGGELRPESSTLRVKDDIRDLPVDAEKLLQLRPVAYHLKPALGGDADIGLIAEEVEKLVPELVVYGPKRSWIGDTGLVEKDEDGLEVRSENELEPYSVRYNKVGVMLLPVVKAQAEKIAQQERRIADLEARLELLEGKIIR